MGLDSVEIALRCEGFFGVTLADEDLAQTSTVRELYELICRTLSLTPEQNLVPPKHLPTISERGKGFLFLHTRKPLPPPAELLPWTPQTVWIGLVAIFVDQQNLPLDEILPDAHMAHDLGID
ncbi:acyl carrier protein [Granulicella cerasi]|uniref:Acyl carrier protein n=1 Tax=Granulicella cerasi TaxID=741063 RepID=A0ABW1ZGM4_9BACT|nr:hypothetical protein [Granulicella cerasi]